MNQQHMTSSRQVTSSSTPGGGYQVVNKTYEVKKYQYEQQFGGTQGQMKPITMQQDYSMQQQHNANQNFNPFQIPINKGQNEMMHQNFQTQNQFQKQTRDEVQSQNRGQFQMQNQGNFPSGPSQGQFAGPQPQGQFPGAQSQRQFPGNQPQGPFSGNQPQGQFSGPQPQGQFPRPQSQGQFTGPKPQGQFSGPQPQGQFPRPQSQGQFQAPQQQNQIPVNFEGGVPQGQFQGSSGGQFAPGSQGQVRVLQPQGNQFQGMPSQGQPQGAPQGKFSQRQPAQPQPTMAGQSQGELAKEWPPKNDGGPNLTTTYPSGFKLRDEVPLDNTEGIQVVPSQPAFKITQPVRVTGDQKWPPKKGQDITQEEVREFIKPKKTNRDYTEFFAQNALPNQYPSYRVPPGTQHRGGSQE